MLLLLPVFAIVILKFYLLIYTILVGLEWSLMVVCVSLVTNDVDHISIYLFVVHISSLVDCLFRYFAHFLLGCWSYFELKPSSIFSIEVFCKKYHWKTYFFIFKMGLLCIIFMRFCFSFQFYDFSLSIVCLDYSHLI